MNYKNYRCVMWSFLLSNSIIDSMSSNPLSKFNLECLLLVPTRLARRLTKKCFFIIIDFQTLNSCSNNSPPLQLRIILSLFNSNRQERIKIHDSKLKKAKMSARAYRGGVNKGPCVCGGIDDIVVAALRFNDRGLCASVYVCIVSYWFGVIRAIICFGIFHEYNNR